MTPLTPRERFIRAARGEAVDRPPCVCPGGMMNAVIRDVMERSGCGWPESHSDAEKMAKLSLAMYREGCFENCGVPFCMTVEAEAMGASVDMGGMDTEPHVVNSPLSLIDDYLSLRPMNLSEGRAAVTIEAIRIIRREEPDVPVVGCVTGPISTAGTLLDMAKLLIAMRKKPEQCHGLISFVSGEILRFARAMIEAGADAVCLAEPSGTGEILGGKMFAEYSVKYVNDITDQLDDVVRIVHICGRLHSVYDLLNEFHCEAFSVDSTENLRKLREVVPGKAVMGSVNTHALATMPEDKIVDLTRNSMNTGADIVAPACGLSVTTPIEAVQAMTAAVKTRMPAPDWGEPR